MENTNKKIQMFFNNTSNSLENINIEIPQYVERGNAGGWIDWGIKNLYPNYLIGLTNRSPLHNAIINMKASMIGRNGFNKVNYSVETLNFLNNYYTSKDNLEQILSKCALDYAIFNGFALIIRWTKDRTRIAEILHISPESIRIAKPNEDDGYDETEKFYVCEDWTKPKKFPPVLYSGFDIANKKDATQILYVREHRSSNNWYPVPDYLAGVSLIELNYHINEYWLHNIKNSFAPSVHINFPYLPESDEERDNVVKRMKMEYQGAKKAGNQIISFCSDANNRPTIDPINNNDNDQSYLDMSKAMMDGIISAHQLTDKKLLGLEVAGELGGSKNEMLESLSIFQAQYIAPKQRFIENIFNKLAQINGCPDKLIIEKYDSNLVPDMDVNDIISILTATISDKQKVEIFVMKGYSRNEAEKIVSVGTKINDAVSNTSSNININK